MSLFQLPPAGLVTRWASAENPDGVPGRAGQAHAGRKGAPCHHDFEPGQTLTLAHAHGSGTLRRMWMTIPERIPATMRGLVLRFYWDGAERPAVEVPLGDFFCMPLGRATVFENAWFDSAEGRSFNCRIPMPFRTGFRCTVTNESPVTVRLFFYDMNWTLGEEHGPDTGYFHASWRRESKTVLKQDFEILPRIQGRGRFLGCNLGVIADAGRYQRTWWGEGEAKFYIDGDTQFPTLCGTGTEDYIGTGWGQGTYVCQWHGSPLSDGERLQYGFYRLHGPDPVYFHEDIRVTMQQIGYAPVDQVAAMLENSGEGSIQLNTGEWVTAAQLREREHGVLFERQDDWCATAYFYLDKPEGMGGALAAYEERVAGLEEDGKGRERFD